MNPFVRIILKLMSSPKIDMQEDYVWVRKMQSFLARPAKKRHQFLDREIYSTDGTHRIPVRIFQPERKRSNEVLLFFHGGGWVLGDIDTFTSDCSKLANETGRMVLSVDYLKAPEHPFPAGLDDCYNVTELILSDPSVVDLKDIRKITLIGNSAGANLAAVISMRLRDEGKVIPHKQILINPVTYWQHNEETPFESVHLYGQDYGLTSKKLQEYFEMYEPNMENRKNPYISPLMADDFSNQPQTLIISSEFDPLRDEGEAYGRALKAAGNKVRIFRANETVHDYLSGPIENDIVVDSYRLIRQFLDDSLEGSDRDGQRSDTTGEKMGTTR